MSNKYRNKPVEVEAMQWKGLQASNYSGTPVFGDYVVRDDEHMEQITDFMAGSARPTAFNNDCIEIDALEGPMIAKPGYWIIKDTKGKFYPCKPDIFEAIYEAVE